MRKNMRRKSDQSIFVVNTTADTSDALPGDGFGSGATKSSTVILLGDSSMHLR
jgi:hypothetical protein